MDTTETGPMAEADRQKIQTTLEAVGERAVEDIENRASERGVAAVTSIRHGVPHEEVVAYVEERQMPSHSGSSETVTAHSLTEDLYVQDVVEFHLDLRVLGFCIVTARAVPESE